MFKLSSILNNLLTKRVLAGLVVGAIAGYAYGYFVGCSGGTCPLTSNPWNSSAYFAFFGVVLTYKHQVPEQDKNSN